MRGESNCSIRVLSSEDGRMKWEEEKGRGRERWEDDCKSPHPKELGGRRQQK